MSRRTMKCAEIHPRDNVISSVIAVKSKLIFRSALIRKSATSRPDIRFAPLLPRYFISRLFVSRAGFNPLVSDERYWKQEIAAMALRVTHGNKILSYLRLKSIFSSAIFNNNYLSLLVSIEPWCLGTILTSRKWIAYQSLFWDIDFNNTLVLPLCYIKKMKNYFNPFDGAIKIHYMARSNASRKCLIFIYRFIRHVICNMNKVFDSSIIQWLIQTGRMFHGSHAPHRSPSRWNNENSEKFRQPVYKQKYLRRIIR